MPNETPANFSRFRREVRELVNTARQVWRSIARRHRWALIGAICIMAAGGVANTGLPLLSGRLVDRVSTGVLSGEAPGSIIEAAGLLLLFVGALVLVRELLQVLRRFLVENTCTRIERL